MGWTVRSLTPADQPDWRALRLEALRDYPGAFLTTFAEQNARSAEADRHMLSMGAWRGLYLDNALIGFAALRAMPYDMAAHRAEIGPVYVTAAQQGTGAARFLMTSLATEARERGIRQLELDVSSANPRAIQFYETLGYIRTGTRPRAIWTQDGPVDDYCYIAYLDT